MNFVTYLYLLLDTPWKLSIGQLENPIPNMENVQTMPSIKVQLS